MDWEQQSKLFPMKPLPRPSQVADYLNEKRCILCQLMAVTANTFSLEAFVSQVHPDLWETINRLTSDKHGRKHSDSHVHERKNRHVYVVCVVMFCAIGGRCFVPLNTLLTDYIEACGGPSFRSSHLPLVKSLTGIS